MLNWGCRLLNIYIFLIYSLLIVTVVISGLLKNKFGNILFILTTAVLSLTGIYGIISLRKTLAGKLLQKEYLDSDFKDWVWEIFNLHSKVIITITALTAIICIFTIIFRNLPHSSPSITLIVIITDIIIFVVSVAISFQSVNKLFDVASYLVSQTGFCILLLFGIFTVKRLKRLKNKEGMK